MQSREVHTLESNNPNGTCTQITHSSQLCFSVAIKMNALTRVGVYVISRRNAVKGRASMAYWAGHQLLRQRPRLKPQHNSQLLCPLLSFTRLRMHKFLKNIDARNGISFESDDRIIPLQEPTVITPEPNPTSSGVAESFEAMLMFLGIMTASAVAFLCLVNILTRVIQRCDIHGRLITFARACSTSTLIWCVHYDASRVKENNSYDAERCGWIWEFWGDGGMIGIVKGAAVAFLLLVKCEIQRWAYYYKGGYKFKVIFKTAISEILD